MADRAFSACPVGSVTSVYVFHKGTLKCFNLLRHAAQAAIYSLLLMPNSKMMLINLVLGTEAEVCAIKNVTSGEMV